MNRSKNNGIFQKTILEYTGYTNIFVIYIIKTG